MLNFEENEIIKQLEQATKEMDSNTFHNSTNLHIAAKRGLLNVVKFLIDKAKEFFRNNETDFKVYSNEQR